MTSTALTLRASKASKASKTIDRSWVRILVLRVAVIAAIAGLWEAVSRLGIINPTEFPPITVVASHLVMTLFDGSTWLAVGDTFLGWLIGMFIAIGLGALLGLLIGRSRFLTRSTTLVTDVLRSTPAPALIFIMVLLLGTTLTMKVALIAFAAIFPIFIQALYGVRSADPVLRDLQRTYRITPATAFFRIRLPAALPFIATGVRVAASLALIVAVIAEYLGGVDGVGHLVEQVRQVGDYPRMYALILLVGFMSVGLNAAVLAAEAKLLSWHPSHRKAS